MTDYIRSLLAPLLDHPDEIRMTTLDGAKTIAIEIRCNAKDLGKVIGKSGKTIGAVRQLAGSLAARNGRRAVVEVVD